MGDLETILLTAFHCEDQSPSLAERAHALTSNDLRLASSSGVDPPPPHRTHGAGMISHMTTAPTYPCALLRSLRDYPFPSAGRNKPFRRQRGTLQSYVRAHLRGKRRERHFEGVQEQPEGLDETFAAFDWNEEERSKLGRRTLWMSGGKAQVALEPFNRLWHDGGQMCLNEFWGNQ